MQDESNTPLPESKPSTHQNSSNQKLVIGAIAGILLGFLIAFYVLDYLPLAANTVLTVVITLFIIVILLFLGVTWYRDKLVKKVFGKEIEFDSLIDETQEVINAVSNGAVDNLLAPLPEPTRQKIKVIAPRVINYLLWSRFRNWGLRIMMTFFIAVGGLVTTILLFNQNKLLEKQNEKIDFQINLEESTRRSSLVFLMANIMDKVDEELKDTFNTKNNTRRLSPQLIGRIVALSQSMKPYRFLDTDADTLTRPLSPERGQLLLSLLNSELDTMIYDAIYSKADFGYSYLNEAKLNNAYLKGSNLKKAYLHGADMSNSDMTGINLSGANLKRTRIFDSYVSKANFCDADLEGSIMHNANLHRSFLLETNLKKANLHNCDLEEACLFGANFSNASLTEVNLKGAYLNGANFKNAEILYVDLRYSFLSGTHVTLKDVSSFNMLEVMKRKHIFEKPNNLSLDQFLKTASLFQCQGIQDNLKEELKNTKPKLFEDPNFGEGN